jgi:hypothetical protein
MFLGAGAIFTWEGFSDADEARQSAQWPTVEGKVLSHSVRWVAEDPTSSKSSFVHEPIVWYAYSVDQVPYKDSRIGWYRTTFHSEAAANEFMDSHYPVGASVLVHYDPHHPHHACLVVGGAFRALRPAFGGLYWIVGFPIFFLVIRMIGKRSPKREEAS